MLKLPPPVWALAYILIALGISRWADAPGLSEAPLIPVAVVLMLLGLALSVTSAVSFRREGTELNPVSVTNRKLVTTGFFSFSRNPMYLGLVLVTLGLAFWVNRWPMFLASIATFATANWVHIPFEESKMRRQFGAEFDAYVRRVRRWV